MKAMIFAAGLGTRLKPLTDTVPKAMVKVGNKPILQYIIEKLKVSGFEEIIINVHHFADQIIDFVRANSSFDIRIEFSDERELLLDTGGGIKKASWFFDDGKPFLVHNVDILSNIDLKELYNKHLENRAIATLVVKNRETSRYLIFDENKHLKGWINKKTGEIKSPVSNSNFCNCRELAFSGIHVINPSVFPLMRKFSEKFSVIDFYLSICNKEKVFGTEPENFSLIDVGKIDLLDEAEKFLSKL